VARRRPDGAAQRPGAPASSGVVTKLTAPGIVTAARSNSITHPKPRRASDLYSRMEMQWERMCRAVECIDARAWSPPPPMPVA